METERFRDNDDDFAEIFNLMFSLTNATYEFKKDGVYVVTMKVLFVTESEKGTWSISDDGKELTLDGEVSEIKELTKSVLKLGPNKSLMGDYADGDDDVEAFTDYTIVFDAK